jgi:hypothetical protein
MAIALLIFGVAFAAFCVWLTVRIVNRRERWAKWTAAGVVLFVLYPLSVGPMYAIFVGPRKPDPPPAWFNTLYAPVHGVVFSAPKTLAPPYFTYLMIWGAQP